MILKVVDLIHCESTLVPGHDDPQQHEGEIGLEPTAAARDAESALDPDFRHVDLVVLIEPAATLQLITDSLCNFVAAGPSVLCSHRAGAYRSALTGEAEECTSGAGASVCAPGGCVTYRPQPSEVEPTAPRCGRGAQPRWLLSVVA